MARIKVLFQDGGSDEWKEVLEGPAELWDSYLGLGGETLEYVVTQDGVKYSVFQPDVGQGSEEDID